MTGCSVTGCVRQLRARGLCATHYARWAKHGNPLFTLRRRDVPEPILHHSHAEIPLGGGSSAMISLSDLPLIDGKIWVAADGRNTRYAVNPRTGARMHRVILGVADRSTCVDHINRNGLDNRRCNLRIATSVENHANSGLHRNNTSGFKGVTKVGRLWKAQAGRGKGSHIGYFQSAEDAAVAYDQVVQQRFGEFALTNKGLGLLGQRSK